MTFKKSNGLILELTNDSSYSCSNCGSDKTYIKIRNGRGSPVWYNIGDDKRICGKCYGKLVLAPRHNKKNNERLKWYRLDYMGINILLSFELPRNKCEICGIMKGQGRKIERHHYFYMRIMPWSCTISLCHGCHMTITHEGKVRVKSITRTCLICNRTDSYKKIQHKYENGHICDKCYHRIRPRVYKAPRIPVFESRILAEFNISNSDNTVITIV